ncbi:MAG: hypothetical protein ACTSQG_09775, partial [Promethearchaeota archaeon]
MGEKKNNSNSMIHGLVLFKQRTVKADKEEDIYSFENIDQENKIKLKTELRPFGSHYRYTALLVNQSAAPITEVKVRIKYPHFLELNRFSPPNLSVHIPDIEDKQLQQINLEFEEINEKSKKQFSFFFNPVNLNFKGELATYVTFVNSKDFVRVLNSEPIDLQVDPIDIEPKIIPSNFISRFLQKPDIKKAIRCFGIGIEREVNFSLIFNHIGQILRIHKFQLIAQDDNKQITWYYGTELESKEDILIIGQIVSNRIEFLGASENHPILIALLTDLAKDFKKRILGLGIINSIDQIYDLECKFCGMVLP